MTYPDNFFEVDFLDVETDSSGDAITIRTGVNGMQTVHVVDGGYSDCGDKILNHIRMHYDGVTTINHVVLTHPDRDHASGLKKVLEDFTVERLWMNRPWLYADELLPYYPTYTDPARLRGRLRSMYPYARDLEELAESRGILIHDAFQGATIGEFRVVSPTREKFLELIVRDDEKAEDSLVTVSEKLSKNWLTEALSKAAKFIASAWGEENLPVKETSPRNEMSVVQFAEIGGQKILLTGDVGQEGLKAFVDYAPLIGVHLPGIDRFQVPHHGSRRNVSTEVLDQILGPRKAHQAQHDDFSALISSAKKDPHHPKKAVVRAMMHRGGTVASTEGQDIRTGWNAPPRDGWSAVPAMAYPTEQEE